jgi:Zn-dependent peptidase ImmA (M78 family)
VKTLERGFKAWAERTSLAFRRELEVSIHEPLPPHKLAEYLGIKLMTPHDIPNLPKDVLEQLLDHDPNGWSGVGIQIDGKGVVIYNPRNSLGRQSSDITHELSHNILEHQPATIIYSENLDMAMRSFNAKQEDEANCLAWSLLLPRDGLVKAKQNKWAVEEIANHYGVSKTLVTFRLNTTGIEAQFKARNKRFKN